MCLIKLVSTFLSKHTSTFHRLFTNCLKEKTEKKLKEKFKFVPGTENCDELAIRKRQKIRLWHSTFHARQALMLPHWKIKFSYRKSEQCKNKSRLTAPSKNN